MNVETITWQGNLGDGTAVILDQTLLPATKKILQLTTAEEMWDAIYKLKVRGAPAIGIAAAFGVVLGVRHTNGSREAFEKKLEQVCSYLGSSRPTAVNLFWALSRMRQLATDHPQWSVVEAKTALLQEAQKILEEDRQVCRAIGKFGQDLIQDGYNILTHCNAGGLATSGYGTALAVIFSAFAQGKKLHVYADETRPLWQGARLTTWELKEAGIPVTLICDNTAAFVMQQNKINIVIVGADRIAANGDVANKIGTYGVAISAKAHGVPFYVAAPRSTFDPSLASGKQIPIEERAATEVTSPMGLTIAPAGIRVYSPAFDITPASLIAGIITEQGILRPPLDQAIQAIFYK